MDLQSYHNSNSLSSTLCQWNSCCLQRTISIETETPEVCKSCYCMIGEVLKGFLRVDNVRNQSCSGVVDLERLVLVFSVMFSVSRYRYHAFNDLKEVHNLSLKTTSLDHTNFKILNHSWLQKREKITDLNFSKTQLLWTCLNTFNAFWNWLKTNSLRESELTAPCAEKNSGGKFWHWQILLVTYTQHFWKKMFVIHKH